MIARVRASGAQAPASPKGCRPTACRRRNFWSKNRYFFGFLSKTLIFFLNPRNLNCVKTQKPSHKKLTQMHKHALVTLSDTQNTAQYCATYKEIWKCVIFFIPVRLQKIHAAEYWNLPSTNNLTQLSRKLQISFKLFAHVVQPFRSNGFLGRKNMDKSRKSRVEQVNTEKAQQPLVMKKN